MHVHADTQADNIVVNIDRARVITVDCDGCITFILNLFRRRRRRCSCCCGCFFSLVFDSNAKAHFPIVIRIVI